MDRVLITDVLWAVIPLLLLLFLAVEVVKAYKRHSREANLPCPLCDHAAFLHNEDLWNEYGREYCHFKLDEYVEARSKYMNALLRTTVVLCNCTVREDEIQAHYRALASGLRRHDQDLSATEDPRFTLSPPRARSSLSQ
jgi:hypothetical protein